MSWLQFRPTNVSDAAIIVDVYIYLRCLTVSGKAGQFIDYLIMQLMGICTFSVRVVMLWFCNNCLKIIAVTEICKAPITQQRNRGASKLKSTLEIVSLYLTDVVLFFFFERLFTNVCFLIEFSAAFVYWLSAQLLKWVLYIGWQWRK